MILSRQQIGELLQRARREKFAVPSFNYSDVWDFLAILEAAEQMKAPVFVASNQRVATTIGTEICGALGLAAMGRATVPVIHHLDHCNRPELCRAAVDHHYPSVMIDCSDRPLDENIRIVNEVVSYARPRGVIVEGEVGRIKGAGIEGVYEGKDFLAAVDDVVRFADETGVDLLAVGIGTAHGFYTGTPEIHFDRLQEIDAAVQTPLVLHGGTGIPEDQIKQAVRMGISKVNVGTIIHCTYMNAVRRELIRRGENAYTLDVMEPVRTAVREEVKGWIVRCEAAHRA